MSIQIAYHQAYFFSPNQPLGQPLNRYTTWGLLRQDPQLEYQVENDRVYVVSTGADISLIVPKDWNTPESYLPSASAPLASAFRYLGLAFLGLSLAGLGTLVFAPLAIGLALRIYTTRRLERADRIRVGIVLALAGALLGVALALNFLLLRHL
jgi:hypothetical protein